MATSVKSLNIAQVRLDNALALFEEYVRATAAHADAATLRGLERRFAERLQIQPSYWSQIKSRSRQIGERLARQFEALCKKPYGWMDAPHYPAPLGEPVATASVASFSQHLASKPATPAGDAPVVPQDEDERFVVGLVLTYYRRDPRRAKTRLMELLSEVLFDPAGAAPVKPAPAVVPLKRKK